MSDIKAGNLVIKPVDIDKKCFNQIDMPPFQHPNLMVGIGHVAAGKTTHMYNMINIMKPIFGTNILIFSPTLMNDPIGKKMEEEEMYLEHFDNYSIGTLKSILKVIKDEHDEYKERTGEDCPEKYLVIFDDILGTLPTNVMAPACKEFNAFISTYRHGGGIAPEGALSLLFYDQHYKDLNVVIRANTGMVFLLGAHSEKQIKTYAEEMCAATGGETDKFMELYHEAKDHNRYDFMTLDMRGLKCYRNFTDELYNRDDDKGGKDDDKSETESDTESDDSD